MHDVENTYSVCLVQCRGHLGSLKPLIDVGLSGMEEGVGMALFIRLQVTLKAPYECLLGVGDN